MNASRGSSPQTFASGRLAALEASAFRATKDLCLAQIGGATDVEKLMCIPALMCAAFSAECGIKALLLKEDLFVAKRDRTHHLFTLFGRLPPRVQDDIVSVSGLDRGSFEQHLSGASDSFVEWRYLYEIEDKAISGYFIVNIVSAIETVARRACP